MHDDLKIINELEKEIQTILQKDTIAILEQSEETISKYEADKQGNVIKVRLSKLNLHKIPDAVLKLKHLRELSFANNEISSLPKKIAQLKKGGMQFTQPTTPCNMWSWNSQLTPFLASTTLEHSRSLTIGSLVKKHALIKSQGFDGQPVLLAPVAVIVRKSLI